MISSKRNVKNARSLALFLSRTIYSNLSKHFYDKDPPQGGGPTAISMVVTLIYSKIKYRHHAKFVLFVLSLNKRFPRGDGGIILCL